MKIFPERSLEVDLSKRKRLFGLALAATVAGSEMLTGIVARVLADRSIALSVVIALSLVLLTLGAIFWIGRLAFREPLRQAQLASTRNERRFRMLARDAADLVCVLDRKTFDIVDWPAMAALLGYSVEEACKLPLATFLHPSDRGTTRACLFSLSALQPRASLTVRLQHKSGHDIWADVVLRRIEHQCGTVETLATVRDVTQRRFEAEEVRAATEAAQRARAEADQANQAKTEFLACISHEIRSPLSSVIGFAGLLLERTDLAPQARLYGERIRVAGKALLTVVDDLLDFSRVEAGELKLSPAPFVVANLVGECLSIVQHAAISKHLAIDVRLVDRPPITVLGDSARIRQVLLNLLYNAIKFTDQGSVLLEIRCDQSSGGSDIVRFSIIDTGIGIDGQDLPRLFRRFAQVDGSIRRAHGGTGLGLAISKRLIELMGGEIGVESEKNVGSTFWFSLPLPAVEAPLAPPQERNPAQIARREVLVVEDTRINQELVRLILEARGHGVDIVGNGTEAIMAVRDKEYDLVLMDLQMPFLDGLTATRLIRQLPDRCRDVPIVAMTANALPEQTRAAQAAGMTDVMHKPFSMEQIDALLARLTGTGSTQAEPESDVLAKLARLVGDAKTKQLLGNLASSLTARFDGDPATAEGRALVKRQAHASVAGSGMLGFARFATACQAFEAAPEDVTFAGRLSALRREAQAVAQAAKRLSESSVPLAIAVQELGPGCAA